MTKRPKRPAKDAEAQLLRELLDRAITDVRQLQKRLVKMASMSHETAELVASSLDRLHKVEEQLDRMGATTLSTAPVSAAPSTSYMPVIPATPGDDDDL